MSGGNSGFRQSASGQLFVSKSEEEKPRDTHRGPLEPPVPSGTRGSYEPPYFFLPEQAGGRGGTCLLDKEYLSKLNWSDFFCKYTKTKR